MKAIVYKSTGSWYVVKSEEGNFLNARILGKFKIDDEITSTNPIAVGDIVDIEAEDFENNYTITAIHKRNNYIIRVSPHNKHQKHIVASNMDQCILLATLTQPKTSNGFIDRMLVTAEAYHIPTIIVFNKSDIYKDKELMIYEHYKEIYAKAGYSVLLLSLKENKNTDVLHEILSNKTSLFTGHSGVGKSTLINFLIPELSLKTKEVSNWSGKGMHTTTFAEIFDLPNGGSIIDTPGIRELGILDIQKEELSGYFPEMRKLINQCRFNNCLHINEPDCIVKQKVEANEMSVLRYESYLSILHSL